MINNNYSTRTIFFCLVLFISFGIQAQIIDTNKKSILGQTTSYIKVDHSDQPWFLETQKEKPNYHRVENLYNTYFSQHKREKSIQKNIVRRWLKVASASKDEYGIVHKHSLSRTDYTKIKAGEQKSLRRTNKLKNTLRSGSTPPNATWNDSTGTWRMIGPYHGRDNEHSYNMYGGFADRVFINPYNPSNMVTGQSYGGLWTSHDAGKTWSLTDSEFPNGKNTYSNRDMYYGEIEAHPANNDQILVGSDAGLLISQNGGDSWTLADSMNYLAKPSERAYFVAQKPDDTDVMLVSYGKKIFRSADGGSSWTMVFNNSSVNHVLSTNQHATYGVYGRWYNFVGLEFHPSEANIVFLGALNTAKEVCLYKSIDAGLSFSLVSNTGQKKWLKMITSLDDPEHVYFANLFVSGSNAAPDEGIYKYDTSGVFIRFDSLQHNNLAGLLDDITVDQKDANIWYYGGYASSRVMKSIDAGKTWFSLNQNSYDVGTIDYVHPDVRSISAVGDTVLVGTDGGLHKSYDGTDLFTAAGKWISAIDLWGFSSAFKGEVLATGDDHGPVEIRTADMDKGWTAYYGADSGDLEINKVRSDYIYANAGSRVIKIVNDSTVVNSHSVGFSANYKYLAQDPDEYFTLYPFYNKTLMVSTDNMVSATDIHSFNTKISKVEIALDNNKIFFVLENNSKVQKSIDGGLTWTIVTPPASVTNNKTNISDIEIDETGNHIWLSYGQYQSNCKVVHSSDGGTTWTNISTNTLPSNIIDNITYQRGTDGYVYISMRLGGVWFKGNNAADWSYLGAGIPTVSYMESIYTIPDCNKFRMGTSRGSFEHELAIKSDLRAHFSINNKISTSCTLDTSYFYDYSSYFDNGSISFNWTFQGGTPSSSNLMNPKVVYEIPGIYDVSLEISDGNGNTHSVSKPGYMTINDGDCNITTIPGKAVDISQNHNYILAPSMNIPNTRNYTMMAWVKGKGTQRDYAGILSHRLSNGYVHLNVRNVSADSTQIGLHHPNGQWWWSTGLYLVPEKWAHLALVVAPNSLTIYKNGVPHVFNVNVAAADLIDKFEIGSMITRESDRCFKGLIDEIAFYDKSLSSDEIRTMMHLTKENPNYVDQHDPNLIAYYQLNEEADIIYDYSGNGKTASLVGNDIHKAVSNGPYGGGTSELKTINNIGLSIFSIPGVNIDFTAPTPNGKVVVSHIENLPDTYPTNKVMHEEGYYICDNYGTNITIGGLNSFGFTKTGFISNQLVLDGGFEIFDRPTNSYEINFNSIISSNIQLTAGNNGSLIATNASPITQLGQYIIGRNNHPLSKPKISMVTPELANADLEGGESISLYIDSDNQGLLLPILNTMEVSTLGQATDGMIGYSREEKTLVLFANDIWNTIKTTPVLGIDVGTTTGIVGVTLGDNSYDPSAILDLKEKGFIKYNSLGSNDLLNVKYPSEGMIVFNIDEAKLQLFNGTRWVSISTTPSTLTVSSSAAALVEGISTENSKVANAVLEDADSDAILLIPSLQPEMIKIPVEGLFLFDPERRKFFIYNGINWNLIGVE